VARSPASAVSPDIARERDRLAADRAQDGVYEFLFSAPPIKVGSPIDPLAVT
jgi:hypothetical protein